MNYKLVVCDFDNTVARSDRTVSDATKDAFLRFKERGGHVAIATGRLYSAIKRYIAELGLDGSVIVCQGAAIHDIESGERIFHQPFGTADAVRILQYLEKVDPEKCVPVIFSDDRCVGAGMHGSERYAIDKFGGIVGVEPVYVGQTLSSYVDFHKISPTKILAITVPEFSSKLTEEGNKLFGDVSAFRRSASVLVEVTEKDVSKGNAIAWLGEKLGVARDEIIAFGDAENDISMIEYAGLGVAMGNAMQELKDAADIVADTNDNDGVAKIITEYCLS